MPSKIIVGLTLLAALAASNGCKAPKRIVLPVCEDVVAPDGIDARSVIRSGRPKVVIFSNLNCLQMIDAGLLRKQINENSDFDFLLYVACDGGECRDMLEHFVHDNRLSVVLFIDKNDAYRKANHVDRRLSYSSVITNPDLEIFGLGMAGSRHSKFDQILSEVRKRMNP